MGKGDTYFFAKRYVSPHADLRSFAETSGHAILPQVVRRGKVQRCGHVLLALPIPFLLTACERIFVVTDADFSRVDVHCVDTAIRQVPGLRGVEHRIDQGEALNNSSADGAAVTQSHWWTYYADEPASIRLTSDGRTWKFSSDVMKWGTPWKSVDLEAFSPEMARVHRALAQKCGLRIPKKTRVLRD